MTVEELIEELQKVKDKKIPVILSYVNVTWSGGCGTCGYDAVKNEDELSSSAENVYDLETRFVIETRTQGD